MTAASGSVGAARSLGTTGVATSPLGFGGAPLGNLYAPVSDEDALAAVAAALDEGIRHFDTAPYYGYGLSEQRLGAALARLPAAGVTLSTKVGRRLVARDGPAREDQGFVGALPFDPVFDYSYDGVMRSFEASLARLGVDRVDVLLMHDIGAQTHGAARHPELFAQAMTGGLRAMQALREAGSVSALGLGVNECAVCLEALEHADLDCFLLAGRFTLLEQAAERALLPVCRQRGVSLIIGGPYNSGILVSGPVAGARHDYAEAGAEMLERVSAIDRVCRAHAVPLPAAALHFPLREPCVASVIPGARSAEEVRQNAEWMRCSVPASLWSDLEAAGLIATVGTEELGR